MLTVRVNFAILILNLRGKLSIFHLSCGQLWTLQMPCIMLRKLSSISNWLIVSLMKDCWIRKCFSCVYWCDHFFFLLLTWCIPLSFRNSTKLAFLGSLLFMVYNPFIFYCIWFAGISLRIFVSVFTRCIGLQFSFLMMSLSYFGIRVVLVSYSGLGSVLILSSFCNSL